MPGGYGSRFTGTADRPNRKKGGFGSRYQSGDAKKAEPKKKHHSFVGQFVTDIKDVAVNLPGGLYHTAGGLIHHPVQTAEGIAKATAEDFRHPLRHPGYTALDLLGLAGGGAETVARLSLAAKTGKASALVRHAAAGERVFHEGSGTVTGRYSRSALTRGAQKAADRVHEKHPELPLPHTRATKIGKARTKTERRRQALANRQAQELLVHSRRLGKDKRAKGLALRVVAEEVPLAQRIAHAETYLKDATEPREKRLLAAHLKRLRRVGEYVHDVKTHDGDTVPRFKPEHDELAVLYQKAKEVAHKRETEAVDVGLLTAEGAARRKGAPGEIIRSDLHQKLGFDPAIIPELFDNHDGFYVTYKAGKPRLVGRPQLGNKTQIGVPQSDSAFKHPLTGASLRQGNVNPDTLKLTAESTISHNRFMSLLRQRNDLKALAHAERHSRRDIPVRPIWLKNKQWPAEVRDIIDGIDNGSIDEEGLRGRLNDLRRYVFPTHLSDAELAKEPGIMWIDKRIVGKENLPGPLATLGQHTGPRVALRTIDAINNATKLALVQLKVGYAVPNIGGNLLALTSQQGVFAPYSLARVALLSHKLDKSVWAGVDTLMGEGIARSLLGNAGAEAKLPELVARFWNPIVDLPFRRAAFLHEAWRKGYRDADGIKRLLNDPKHQKDLLEVADSANEAILDYSRLGPVEQDIIRRVIFLYPFVKASTLYGGHFLTEHPIQSAIAAQVGAEQKIRRDRELGPVPSWAEALFKVGGTDSQPLVSNPAAIALLQTPAQLLETARRAFTGGGGSAYDIANQLNPAISAGLVALTHKDPFSGHDFGRESSAKLFASQLAEGIPARLLVERLRHGKYPGRTFPMGSKEAILQFLAGTAAPRTADRARLNQRANDESGR